MWMIFSSLAHLSLKFKLKDPSQIQHLITFLMSHFKLKDFRLASYFLGIEFQQHQNRFLLTQTKYTTSVLHTLKIELCKSLPTLSPTTDSTAQSKIMDNSHIYRNIMGALQYLNITRPDISFAVNQVCQSMHSPQSIDWIRLKHLLHYLKGTINYELYFTQVSPVSLMAFSDADWVGDTSNCCSTSGFLIYLSQNLVSWSSKKQPTIARSSTEVEYKVIANATSKLI